MKTMIKTHQGFATTGARLDYIALSPPVKAKELTVKSTADISSIEFIACEQGKKKTLLRRTI